MKTMWLSIILIVTVIIGSYISMQYLNTEAVQMHQQLAKLEKEIDSENWDKAKDLYDKFKEKWEKVDPRWSMLIDHTEIDYINMDLGELEAYIKTKNKANALAKVSSLQLLVKHIPEKESPGLKNLL